MGQWGSRRLVRGAALGLGIMVLGAGSVFACGSEEPATCEGAACVDASSETSTPPVDAAGDGALPADASDASATDSGDAVAPEAGDDAGCQGQPGTLDTSFGDGGISVVGFAGESVSGDDLAIQPDGKIIVGGVKTPAGDHFAVMRFTRSGALDTTFGTNGVAQTRVGNTSHSVTAVALQPDGKILLAGFTRFVGQNPDFALLRYTSDGVLDATFGVGGVVLTDFGTRTDQVRAMALMPDGRIVLGGQTLTDDLSIADMAFARYMPDGTLDSTFGTGGRAVVDVRGTRDEARGVAVLSGGQIVASGLSKNTSGDWYDVAVVKLLADGSFDSTFGQSGRFVSAFGGPGSDVGAGIVVDSSGKLVVAGLAGGNDIGALRLTTSGAVDPTFGVGGRARIDFASRNEDGTGVVLEPGGKVLLVGVSASAVVTDTRVGIARLLADGSADSTFGVGGSMLVPLPPGYFGGSGVATAVALDRCGAVIVGGWLEEGLARSRVGLIRIHR